MLQWISALAAPDLHKRSNRIFKMANLPISEAAKLGVTVNGGHLDGRAEYVPIKKRRLVYGSPSPPPPPSSNSPRSTESNMPEKTECHLGQESLTCQDIAIALTVEANDDVNMKKLDDENDHMHVNEDFSGISILASIDLGQEEEFQWDLNEVGTDKLDYEDLDHETDTTDAISRSPDGCNVSDKMKNNEAMSSPHLSENCVAIQSGVSVYAVTDQVRTSGHDNTDIVIPPNDPASLGGIQVQEIFELKMDYDSEYEDGELIESIEHTWEEYDVQDVQAEHVSYESDDADRFGSNAFNRQVSMSEGAECKKLCLTDINSSSSVEAFSLKNVHKSNIQDEVNISRGSDLKLDRVRLLHANENHRKNEWNNLNRTIKLNIGQISGCLLPKSCKSSVNLETRVRGFIDRRNIEGKVFESRPIRKEFQSRVNNSANNGLSLREFRVQGSRFNDFNESKSRYERDWNAHKYFGRSSIPSHHNWRQTRNSTDRPIKRVRSPSGSPTLPLGRYTRDYRGRFDDRDSDHPHHLVARERSFSPAENPLDFHSNRPYRRNSVTSHDFRSRDRSLNLRTSHLNAGFSQQSDTRSPTRIIPSDKAYGVSDSLQRINQNNYSRPRLHERFSRVDEENDYDQRHGYRYKHNPDIRRRNSDDDFEIIRYVDRDDSCAAARRPKELQNSFFHRQDREFNANSK